MVRGVAATLSWTLALAAVLAGCVEGDSPGDDDGDGLGVAADAVATEETGSVQGQVMTVDLEPIVGVEVRLVAANNETAALETKTDAQGRFTFNGVAPGGYRVHAAPECCKTGAKDLNVHAGAVAEVSLLLDRVVTVKGFIVEKEWVGFIACGVYRYNACPLDGNDYRELHFEVLEGLQTLVVGMVWESGGASSPQLQLDIQRWESPAFDYSYASVVGDSPIVVRVDDGTIDRDDAKFSAIDGGLEIRYEANVPIPGLAYQQAFTLYWQEHYHAPAPDDANPVPDG